MKSRILSSLGTVLLVGALSAPVLSQTPNKDQKPNDPQDRQFNGDNFGRGGGGGGRGGRGGGGGFDPNGGPGGMRGPGIEIAKYEALRAYIETVDRYSKLADDPNSSGVAAVISASDLLRQRGPDAAIEYFTKVLPNVSPQVERAIRIQLADLYKMSGKPDMALQQYELLMRGHTGPTAAPASQPAKQ